MKHLFICLLAATFALSASAQQQVRKDVLVKKAGTLATIIPPDELCQITHLRVVGKINGEDIRWIRKMAGATDNSDSIDNKWGQLVDLDLNEVEIVKGKATYLDARSTEKWRHSTTYSTKSGKYKSSSSFSDSYDLSKPLTPEQWKEFRSTIGTKQVGRFYTIDDQGYVTAHYTTENNILGFYMFDGCVSLQRLILPSGIQLIRTRAISNCHSLQKIAIPAQCGGVQEYGITDCHSLELVLFLNPKTRYKPRNFFNCSPNIQIQRK